MYGAALMPCAGAGCVQRLQADHLRSLLRLRLRPAYFGCCALFSLGGGYLADMD